MKSNPAKKMKSRGIVAKKSTDNEENAVDDRQQRKQMKQMKRVRFLAKLDNGGRTTLSANKPILKKKKRKRTGDKAAVALANLSSLADDLPSREEVMSSAQNFQKKVLRNESRQQIVVKETKQLAAVLAHPEFQRNPLLAIQRHLTNTVVVDEPPTKTHERAKKQKARPTKKGASAELMEE